MKTFWRLYASLLLIALSLGVVFAAWSAYEIYYYENRGEYEIELGNVSAFASNYGYRAGEAVDLYVHSTSDATGRLFRYGASREELGIEVAIPRTIQSNRYTRRDGVTWRVTATLPTEGLKPGLYALEIRQNDDPDAAFVVPIILKPTVPPPIAVIASTNTWEAYNAFGGASNYRNSHINPLLRRIYTKILRPLSIQLPDEILPRARPNSALSQDLIGHEDPLAPHYSRLARAEWTLIAFLEREGYDYGVYSARDFAFSEEPSQAKLLVFHGHAEYWAPEMFYRFERYERSGGRVFVSAGNPMFRAVEFRPQGISVSSQDNDREMVSRRIGSYFTHAGMMTAAPYRVDLPMHWAFAGTGLSKGDEFGAYSANVPKQSLVAGKVEGETGASGIFTNKLGMGSGDFLLLATGLNSNGPAHMVCRETGYGGWVFNTSSGSFTGALGHDTVADRIMKNVIETALAARDPS